MTITNRKRWEIVFLSTHPLGPKMNRGAVAKYLHCTTSTVKKWLKRYNETGSVDEISKPGCSRATTKKQDEKITKVVEAHNNESLDQLQQRLNKLDVVCSRSTLHNRIKEAGFKSGTPLKKSFLMDRHRAQRLAWAEQYKDHDSNSTLYADATTMLT